MADEIQPSNHNFADTLTLFGLGASVIMWALVPSTYAKGAAVVVGTALLAYLAYRSHFSRNWSPRIKHIAAILTVIVLFGASSFQLIPQWRLEHHKATVSNPPQQPPKNATQTPDPAKSPVISDAQRATKSPLNQVIQVVPVPIKPSPQPATAAPLTATTTYIPQPSVFLEAQPQQPGCRRYENDANEFPVYSADSSAALKITAAQRFALRDEMQAYAGTGYTILLPTPTAETLAQAAQLEELLSAAGLVCVLQVTTDEVQSYLPGIHVENSGNLVAAAQLKKSLNALYTITDDLDFDISDFIEADKSSYFIDIVIAP